MLGVIFISTFKWAKCRDNLSGKALKTFAGIRKLYSRLKNLPADIIFKTFENKTNSTLWVRELWGWKQY